MSRAPRTGLSPRPLLPLALAGLLAFAAIAGMAHAAKRFDPSNKKMVVNKSIAGVRLGQSIKAAKKAWGNDVRCNASRDVTKCQWRGGSERRGHLGFIYATGTDSVFQVSSVTGTSRLHKRVFAKPLTTVKTSKGIGLGSKKSAVKRAYPGGSNDTDDCKCTVEYELVRGRDSTNFFFEGRRASIITIERLLPGQRR